MNTLLKIPRKLLLTALADLERSHPFACERLGFFSFRQSLHPDRPLILCYDYHPIPDEHYIRDDSCGARIGGDAIRAAMERSYRENAGQIWIHTHGRRGIPSPSPTDMNEGPNVVKSLGNIQPKTFQGWAVISEDGVAGQVRAPDGRQHDISDLSVIGWPMTISVPQSFMFGKKRRRLKRYDRQSFLGKNSQAIIENVKIGIVGLGGGGSHINQQLAHIGFQSIVPCDPDRVELTNLNRLVGATLQDVRSKRLKIEIASRVFRKLQPKATIDARPLRWEDKRDSLRDCDIIFGCLDSFSARRDLEAFCRSLMIPLIDIGMTVIRHENSPPEICGQTILSMPGEHCMHCLQFLTPDNLATEVQDYNAGAQPQVVWPNGILASNAVGYAMALLTGWSGSIPSCRIDYRGSQLTSIQSNFAAALKNLPCKHFPLSLAGDPIFKKL